MIAQHTPGPAAASAPAPTPSAPGAPAPIDRIDREALVRRHTVRLTEDSPELVLTLGNGDFAFSADATGLQTFTAAHDSSTLDPRAALSPGAPRIVETGTLSTWGWHEQPNPAGYSLADTMTAYETSRGPVDYPDRPAMRRLMAIGMGQETPEPSDLAGMWLGSNPHRLDLGRLGLVLRPAAGAAPETDPASLAEVEARLDLWTGRLDSSFSYAGERAEVTTAVAGRGAVVATRVSSPLLADGRAALRLSFADPNPGFTPAGLWGEELVGSLELVDSAPGRAVLERTLDSTTYRVTASWTGGARAALSGGRDLLLVPAPGTRELELVLDYEPVTGPGAQWYEAPEPGALTSLEGVLASAAAFWKGYWTSGAAVELTGSTDPRAEELERRLVLSQYLVRANGGGLTPPQETGLITNTWRGKFHLEMHWWHGAQFAAWGRPELLERSFAWYRAILPAAQATAAAQGCTGARWPKEIGPDAREAPGDCGPFLIWQQPHLLYFAELCWAAYGTRPEPEASEGRARLLSAVGDLLDETAAFMASYPSIEEVDDGADGLRGGAHRVAHLGAPVMPAQEFYDAAVTRDPTYELAYWWFGLELAQRFRERRGLVRVPEWTAVQEALPAPEQVEGRYTAVAGTPSVRTDDHPSFLQALGFLPPTPLIEAEAMGRTLDWVRGSWEWDTAWGWDYPVMAMTATRLGRSADAVDLLLQDGAKNRYDAVGNNPGSGSFIPLYLPGNGGLLSAVGLMAAGWEGSTAQPGFPDDGTWRVRAEGLTPWPLALGAEG